MLDLLKSLGFVIVMVPLMMAIILGLIYLLGEFCNVFSKIGHQNK